ncbi:MAG: aldo/keto reductase [Bacteroidota bacterium]|jgi:aryl-alcohol dehydrogenase-like predicted oxidoreductase
MKRRELLKSALIAGTGVAFTGHIVEASVSTIHDADEKAPENSRCSNLTKKRTLGSGKAALTVPALALGIMGMQSGRGIVPDEKQMEKLIRESYERGCNFFDTAEGYSAGKNEELLGRAIASIRDKVIIGTKFTVDLTKNPPANDNRPERIKAACEASLRRLKTDYIDLYHQHRIDRNVPIEDVAGAVADLIKQGKVRYFGLSEVSAQTIRQAHKVQPVTTVQSEYHLMFRKPETEIFDTLKELGIGFTAYSPINRGFLGGSLTEYADMNNNDIRGVWPRFTPEALRVNSRILQVLNEFGKKRGMTSAQIAMAWMMSKHSFIVPLFGTSKLSHLEEDLRTANFAFTADEIKELETKVAAFPVMGERYDTIQQARVEY